MAELENASEETLSYAVTHEKQAQLEAEVRKLETKKVKTKEPGGLFFACQRIAAVLMFFFLFIPNVNPSRVCGMISRNQSLFTSAVSYTSLISGVGRGFRSGWIDESVFKLLFAGSIIAAIGTVLIAVGSCISLGNNKCKKLSGVFSLSGSVVTIAGLFVIRHCYELMKLAKKVEKVEPTFPAGFYIFLVMAIVIVAATVAGLIAVPKVEADEKFEMESKFKLFLMFVPFAMLAFVFCYLPLWGWRYAFFDYKAGDVLSMDKFVGFKWFKYLFQNAATRRDIVRVLRNTLAMSGLGILTSWVPLAFAVFLSEITNKKFKRFVQVFTTVPNFISWILVYTIALAIFSTDGFINTFLSSIGQPSNVNYLMNPDHTWLKMLAWGIWKGVGWSAIIYIAGITGIDKQLYEAATVDGAGRFQRIWNVTIPGLIPTYMVMLLMGVAGMLSNGLDQYLVFSNANNSATMEVLDLYVYHLGFGGGSIPLSTVIGMTKSIVSVALLFMANSISKVVRHESIV